MDENRQIWRSWAEALQRWGARDLAAVMLESAGPFALLGAQAVYLGQPLLKGMISDEQLDALATMLEEPSETQAFVTLLREAN